MKSVVLSLRYIRYYLTAKTKHDIHSPFVYNLLTEVISRKEENAFFLSIEKLRQSMLKNDTVINIRDFGAGFGGKTFVERKIKFVAHHSSKSKKYGQLLHRLVKHFSPSVMLELGTSVGVSAMYQASAAHSSKFITLEGCENTAEIAASNFKKLELKNIVQVTGDFEKTLPEVLKNLPMLDYVFIDGNHRKEPVLKYFYACLEKSNKNTLFIIDDINWSMEMMEAWNEIKADPRTTITIDLFMLGLVFINPDHTKQNFIIRF
jgi:predicted O-methyltransferase YrrM